MIKIGDAIIADTVKFYVADSAQCIISDGVEIRDNVVIECGDGGDLYIAPGAIVNYGVWINASGKVHIGSGVLIAPNVSITSSSHRYDLKIPIKEQGLKVSKTLIGDNAWIGAGSTILAGSEIGKGSIVAANSVVKYKIADGCIAAGNPAVNVALIKYKKIIFYTLPLVIRNQPTLFSSIVDVYLPLARNFAKEGWECIFVGTDELLNEYPEFEFQWISPSTLNCKYPVPEDGDWLSSWKLILADQPLSFHDDFVGSLIGSVDPDIVFCWNYDGALRKACNASEVPVLFNELGLLRSPNPMAYYSDSEGVNVNAGMKAEFDIFCLKKDNEESLLSTVRIDSFERNYKLSSFVDHSIVLILLQVQDDSNIIMGSPFSSMFEYVECVTRSIEVGDRRVVVKPHPLDLVPELPRGVEVADKGESISSLIASASAVFTINSSAGFEAALAGKTVYVMGRAPYSGLGLTVDVPQPSDLKSMWSKIGENPVCDQAHRAKVLNFVENYYFVSEENFSEPAAHLLRLKLSLVHNPERHGFDSDLEVYRQQTYISWLEKKNKEIISDLIASVEQYVALSEEHAKNKSAFGTSSPSYETYAVELLSLKEELLCLENELWLNRTSLSWRVTRPLRLVRRLFIEPRTILRMIYQRIPFLVSVRVHTSLMIKNLRSKLFSVINSKNNKVALRMMSDRRFTYHKDSVVVDESPLIDVSVVTYNSEKWVDGYFESLHNQSYPLDKINIFFVDNGSKDSTVEKLQAWKSRVGHLFARLEIIVGGNVGFGAGHQKAIVAGAADYILVSNIDIVFSSDPINIAVRHALSDAQEEVASWELRQAPYEHPKYYDPVTLETNWSSHACILIRRSAYEKVGGYDEQIFMYGEDVELSYRFRSFGYLLKYCPSAIVYHYTYEHEHEVKPLQYSGSTLANAFIRLRYGNLGDRLGGALLQCLLLCRPEVYSGSRKDLARNLLKIVKKAPHFLRGKGSATEAVFPFRGFDYELTREGAFWPVGQILDEHPLVTIVTRTYRNRNAFLKQSIQSVLNQTYRNIELIVVEDGGETMQQLVSSFGGVDETKVSFYGLDKVGRSVTGNYGLQMAQGEYCMFLDDDDLLFSDHVEVLVAALQSNKSAVAAYSLAMEVKTDSVTQEGHYVEVSHDTPGIFKQPYDYSTLKDHNFIPIQSLMFKRTLYLERGGFETDMDNLEDWNLWLRYGFNNEFVYVPKTTSLFRTPASTGVRIDRHKQLHEAYGIARNRAMDSCASYR